MLIVNSEPNPSLLRKIQIRQGRATFMLSLTEARTDDDEIVCSICMDAIQNRECILPGCNHQFHYTCMLNFAQYDTKCPVCRQLPTGVVVRRRQSEVEDNVVQIDMLREHINEAQRTWTRYFRRRSACIRKHPDMRDLNNSIRSLRSQIQVQTRTTQRCFDTKCNTLWKTDDELQVHKKTLNNLERKHRRLKKKLKECLEVHLGPQPDPPSPIFMFSS